MGLPLEQPLVEALFTGQLGMLAALITGSQRRHNGPTPVLNLNLQLRVGYSFKPLLVRPFP
ncbi:MAG TPA: hypothetical protein VE057_16970 [Archangium sp.]|nr:hypothetical protein [Archangium sp.]